MVRSQGLTDLVDRMAERQLTQCGHGEGLAQQMRAQKVRVVLVHQELGVAHPRLGQQPIPLGISRQKDGALRPRSLAELRDGSKRRGSRLQILNPRSPRLRPQSHLDGQGQQRPLRVEPQQAEWGCYVLLAAVQAIDRCIRQDPVVGQEYVPPL